MPLLEVAIAHEHTKSWKALCWRKLFNSMLTEFVWLAFKITKCLLLTSYVTPMFLNVIWETLSYRETQKKIRVIGKKRFDFRHPEWKRHAFGGQGQGGLEVWITEGFSLACQNNRKDSPASRLEPHCTLVYIWDLAKELSSLSPGEAVFSGIAWNSFSVQILFW